MSKQYRYLLAHPSYGRPEQAADYARRWIGRARNRNVVYSLAIEEHETETYKAAFRDIHASGVEIYVWPGKYGTCVSAANAAVMEYMTRRPNACFDIVVLVSDDMDCPEGWCELVEKAIRDKNGGNLLDANGFPFTVQVSDGVVKHILTLPILSYAAWAKLGYVYHPSYASMYADNDLRMTSDRHLRTVDLSHIVFTHNHWAHGKAKKDATYLHHDNTDTHVSGSAIFEARKAKGFPLDVEPFIKNTGNSESDTQNGTVSELPDADAHPHVYAVPEATPEDTVTEDGSRPDDHTAGIQKTDSLLVENDTQTCVNEKPGKVSQPLSVSAGQIMWPVTVYRNDFSGEFMIQPYLLPVSGRGNTEQEAYADMLERLQLHLAMVEDTYPSSHKSYMHISVGNKFE